MFGSNVKAKKQPKSIFKLFIEACDDFTLKILIFAAFVSISIFKIKLYFLIIRKINEYI